MFVYYSPAYAMAGYAFDTTRKARWIAESLAQQPIPTVALRQPAPLSAEQVCAVHDSAYVEAVRSGEPRHLAESQGFPWDAALWHMVLASNGGALAAAQTALAEGTAGSLSSGLHHARRDHGAGFCTFNGLALAARAALDMGARRVLILDLDAHCGGGTHSLIAHDERIWQLDIAVDAFDIYVPTERTTLSLLDDPRAYLPVLEQRLRALDADAPAFGLCLYNAGMDPYEGCPIGGLPGVSKALLAQREEMVFTWLRQHAVPVAFVLAGGYVGATLAQAELVALHRLTIAAACGAAPMQDAT